MSGLLTRQSAVKLALGLAALAVLAGCKIVSIGSGPLEDGAFDAAAYAEGIWASQALPHLQSVAQPIDLVLAAVEADIDTAGSTYGHRPATEGSAWTFVVSGRGKATAKNTESRTGTLTITVEGATPVEVPIQIGPVVRGNSVRDALPFVSFKDFTNQLEFADVGKALTALSVAGTAKAAQAAKVGDIVNFTGVMSLNSSTDRILVTPVLLEIGG